MVDYVTEAMIGTKVTFTSLNPNDAVVWNGTVLGLVTYAVAKSYGDMVSYRGAVLQADPTIDVVEDLHYFIIQLDEVEGQPQMVFASEFITPGSLAALNLRETVNIAVSDFAANNHNDILDILRAAGYTSCRITSVVT